MPGEQPDDDEADEWLSGDAANKPYDDDADEADDDIEVVEVEELFLLQPAEDELPDDVEAPEL